MKRLVPFLCLLMLGLTVLGQASSENYQQRYYQLYKDYAQNPNGVECLLQLAEFFADAQNPQFNLPLAAGYVRRAEEEYSACVKDKKRYKDSQRLIRKGITIMTIREMRKVIDAQSLQYIQSHAEEMGMHEMSAFREVYRDDAKIGKLLRTKEISDAYAAVLVENTVRGYYDFIKAHPGSSESELAETRLAPLAATYFSVLPTEAAVDSVLAIYPGNAVMLQAATAQKSRLAYITACRSHTVESYSAYLEHYPRGDYYLDALEKLQQLRGVDLATLKTPADLADFAEVHSDEPLADSAIAQLRRMVLEQHSQEAANQYLSRFPLDEEYSNIYREYYSWYASEGNRDPIETFAQQHRDYPYQLAIQSDLDRASRIDAYDLTKRFQESDFDTMTTIIRRLTGRRISFVALQRILQRQIASKDFAGAKSRMDKFDISFEDLCQEEYAELKSLLSSGGPSITYQFGADSVSRVIPHPRHAILYYTQQYQGHSRIGIARHTTGNKWKADGFVDVQGAAANVECYNFYDRGEKVLLGISGDIYTAKVLNDTTFVIDRKLEYPVNTSYMERDAYMLHDGSGILLASDRPGGHNTQTSNSYFHGDYQPATDIYYIPFRHGAWGNAINLGLDVNSPYCELSPILSRNMRTLYFVTDARGLGYGDVYRCTREDVDDWTHWSRPVNLGRGVNGAMHETSVAFGGNEKQVLLTSQSHRGGQPGAYTFPAQHDTLSAHRSIVIDYSQVMSVVRTSDLVEVWRQQVGEHATDRELDTLQTYHIYKHMPYALIVVTDWFYVPSVVIDDASKDTVTPRGYTLDELRNMEQPIPMPLVDFYPGTPRLLPLAEHELQHLGRYLQQRTSSEIEILVHVPGSDDQQCFQLSTERALMIRAYLESYGVDISRITISPFSNTRFKLGEKPAGVEIRFL